MNQSSSHVVEWSVTHRSFRVRTVGEFVASNVQQFFEGDPQEYALLGYFDSPEEAWQFVNRRSLSRAA